MNTRHECEPSLVEIVEDVDTSRLVVVPNDAYVKFSHEAIVRGVGYHNALQEQLVRQLGHANESLEKGIATLEAIEIP